MKGPTLTENQRQQLKDLERLRLPTAWVKEGWPGHPEGCVDRRSMPALQRLGLVETGTHRGVPWWRITSAGRAALKAPS